MVQLSHLYDYWKNHSFYHAAAWRWSSGCVALEWRLAERRYPTSKVRSSKCEETTQDQSQEQLNVAGPAVWRYPTSKVRGTPVRW